MKKLNQKSPVVIFILNWLILWLPIFMLASLPVLDGWLDNLYQVTGQDLILPEILCFLTSLLIAAAFYCIFKKNRFIGLLGAILASWILNENFASKFHAVLTFFKINNFELSLNNSWQAIFVLGYILLILAIDNLICYFFYKLIVFKQWNLKILAGGLVVTISVIFLLQLFPVVRALVAEWPQFFYQPPKLTGNFNSGGSEPDIWYIVLDRYASQPVLQNQLGYSNADFMNFLQSNNFYVNNNDHNNYPYTTMSIASTLNANYLSDVIRKFSKASDQTLEPYHDSIRYASVIYELKALGYSYDELGNWYESSNTAPLANYYYQPNGQLYVFNHRFTLNEYPNELFKESFYFYFIRNDFKIGRLTVLNYTSQSEIDAALGKLSLLKNLASQSSGGRFIFAHLLTPHDPYYFNADGTLNANSGNDNVGEPIQQKYLNQVKFINSQMKEIINEIQKNSHNQAIIVLQSDEGPYPMQLNNETTGIQTTDELNGGDMTKWSTNDLEMKLSPLAAYHVPEATSQSLAEGGDSVNIFRLILNTYFGGKLPYLPECFYVYSSGRAQTFIYKNVNKLLTGQANPACPDNSIF